MNSDWHGSHIPNRRFQIDETRITEMAHIIRLLTIAPRKEERRNNGGSQTKKEFVPEDRSIKIAVEFILANAFARNFALNFV